MSLYAQELPPGRSAGLFFSGSEHSGYGLVRFLNPGSGSAPFNLSGGFRYPDGSAIVWISSGRSGVLLHQEEFRARIDLDPASGDWPFLSLRHSALWNVPDYSVTQLNWPHLFAFGSLQAAFSADFRWQDRVSGGLAIRWESSAGWMLDQTIMTSGETIDYQFALRFVSTGKFSDLSRLSLTRNNIAVAWLSDSRDDCVPHPAGLSYVRPLPEGEYQDLRLVVRMPGQPTGLFEIDQRIEWTPSVAGEYDQTLVGISSGRIIHHRLPCLNVSGPASHSPSPATTAYFREEPSTVEVYGIPVELSAKRFRVQTTAALAFGPDSDILTEESKAELARLRWQCYENPEIVVVGYVAATATGSRQYRQELAQARSRAVTAYLEDIGYPADKLTGLIAPERISRQHDSRDRRAELHIRVGPPGSQSPGNDG